MKQEAKDGNMKIYLAGLKKYRERGIPILIDGEEAELSEWQKLFQVCEDGSFYMGDYVLTETLAGGTDMDHRRKLKEIRFDKVYYR